MKKSSILLVIGLVALMILSVACAKTQTPVATTEAPDAAYTASIQTIVAGLTESAPTQAIVQGQVVTENTPAPTVELPVPTEFVFTDTPLPTETPAATPTPEYSATPAPTETPAYTDTPEPTITATETPLPKLVYQDNFASKVGWTMQGGENYGFDFLNGGYQIFVKIKNVPIWSVRKSPYQDVQVEADVTEKEDSKGGYFGLVCRHSGGGEFYAFVIGSDGFYGIAKKGNGVFSFLKQGGLPAEANLSGDQPNRVRADCLGNTLALYVNGLKIAEIQDKSYLKGDVGMVVGSRSKGTVTVLFDDFAVYSP
jgi:hypothetical protein